MKRLVLVVVLVALACKKEEGSTKPPGAALDAAPLAKEPAKPKLPWDTENKASYAALQGAWLVTGFGSYGRVQAWNVEGKKVTVYEPKDKTEKADELVFDAPCDVRLADAGWGGTFTKQGDTVHLGLGSGGWKEGDTIIACMSPGVVHSTPAGCKAYKQTFDEWEVLDATCTVEEGRFKMKDATGFENDLRFVDENTLMTDQLASNKPQKMPDWAAAKAKADELFAAETKEK